MFNDLEADAAGLMLPHCEGSCAGGHGIDVSWEAGLLKGDALSNSPAEQRRSPRVACVLDAEYVSGEKTVFNPAWPIRVLNISKHGIALHTGEQLEVGTVVTLKVFNQSGKSVKQLPVQIIHSTQQPNRTWIVGANFPQSPLTDEELQLLLS